MPVVRIPVQHKFGIVSLSRAEQLLARSNHRKEQKCVSSSPSHQVNQAFIIKYNSTAESERDSLDTVLVRALHHAKYKAGLIGEGSSPSPPAKSSLNCFIDDNEIDISGAWLELTLLCQCYGRHQQDVLVTLATTLNHAPLSAAHIPSLFYIAGLCYQWLKSDVLSSDLLRSGELILLKVLYLVSIRILYHHLTCALMDGCTTDEVRQYKFDLEGFENRERAYRNFPEALLHWKIALEVGLLVCEASSKPSRHNIARTPLQMSSSTHSAAGASAELQGNHQTEERSESKSDALTGATVGHSDVSLSPILWHALDVWQCTKQGGESLHEATEDLLSCSTDFDAENWIEGMLAMNVLCTASERMVDVLHLVQSLARGSTKHPHLDEGQESHTQHQQTTWLPRSTKECLAKHSASVTPTDDKPEVTADLKKGTRFTLPSSAGKRHSRDERGWRRLGLGDSKKPVKTLNVLGMQPDFSESLMGSMAHSFIADEEGLTTSASRASEGDGEPEQSRSEEPSCTDVLSLSVRTQSLIENESIPATPPSQYSSNTSILDLGSSTTLEAGLSRSKSVGFLASSNSYTKNLSAMNVLSTAVISTDQSETTLTVGVEPDASTTSLIPVQRKLVSPVSGPLVDYSQRSNFKDDLPTLHEVVTSKDSHREGHPVSEGQTNHNQQRLESRCTHYTHSTAPLSGGAGVLGSQVPPSTLYRRSTISTPATELPNIDSAATMENHSKFENWPVEVALMYTLNMASIVIYGRSSLIQKIALEGTGSENLIQKYGLMQLVDFSASSELETNPTKCSFNSWSIRHGAVLGLSRVCRACSNLPMKDGLSDLAWSKLMKRHSCEDDSRVIEAYKLSKSCSDLDQVLLMTESQCCSSPLFAHIADGLSQVFLPPVTPAPDSFKVTRKQRTRTNVMKSSTIDGVKIQVKDIQPRVVTHFESKPVPPTASFNSRAMGALNKIAEEHWKRQMKQEKEEEEKERQKEELQQQKEYEEKMKRKAEKLAKRRPKPK